MFLKRWIMGAESEIVLATYWEIPRESLHLADWENGQQGLRLGFFSFRTLSSPLFIIIFPCYCYFPITLLT